MSRDIFSKNFRPYIAKTKGFWSTYGSKRTYIPTHYSYVDKYSVRTLDFRSNKDRNLYYRMKKSGRIFND